MTLLGVAALVGVAIASIDPIQTGRGYEGLIVAEAIAISLFSLAPLIFRLTRIRELDPFEPCIVFGLVYTLVFAIRPLFLLTPWVSYAYELPTEVYRFLLPSNQGIALAMFYGLIGIVCYQIGYGSLFFKPEPEIARYTRTWSSPRVTHVAIIGLTMAFFSVVLLYPVIGSASTLLANFGMVRSLLVGYGYQSLGIDLLPVVILIVFVDYLEGTRRPILILLLAVSNGYNLLIGSRAGVFNVWLFLALAYYYMRRVHFKWRQATVAALIVTSAVLFSVSASDLRNTGLDSWSDIGTVTRKLWSETPPGMLVARTLAEFDQVDVFATTIDVGPPTFPFMYGKTYLDLLFQPIPRAWWPSKPWGFDDDMGYFAVGVRTAIPPGMVGEMYVNFRVFGVVAGMLFFGWLCRRVYQKLITVPRAPTKVLFYALLLPYLPIIMTRSFLGAGTTIGVLGGFAWLAGRYISGSVRDAHPLRAWGGENASRVSS